MAKSKKEKASNLEALPVLERENVLVFKVTRPVTDTEFVRLEQRLREQEEKAGVKIVLIPHSVKLKED